MAKRRKSDISKGNQAKLWLNGLQAKLQAVQNKMMERGKADTPFMKNWRPLFDEFQQFVISITDQSNRPATLQVLESNFNSFKYETADELLAAMQSVESELKRNNASETAKKLDSFKELTIVPVVYEPGMLKLYHFEVQPQVELNDNNQLEDNQYVDYKNLSYEDSIKLFMRWSLPHITAGINKEHKSSTNISSNKKIKDEPDADLFANLQIIEENKEGSDSKAKNFFIIDGTKYKIGSTPQLAQYNIVIAKRNYLNRDMWKNI